MKNKIEKMKSNLEETSTILDSLNIDDSDKMMVRSILVRTYACVMKIEEDLILRYEKGQIIRAKNL